MIAEHETTVAGTRIHWLEAGTGDPPLLLLHGWGSSTAKWLDVLPVFAEQRRTIALDLPGFGRSDAPVGPYTPSWLAGGVIAFLDEIGVASSIWVGNSLGGLVAIYGAAAHPERVPALVAVSPALPSDSRPASLSIVLQMIAPAVPGIGEAIYRRYIGRDPERVVREGLERNCADPSRVSETTRRALLEDVLIRRGRRDHARAVVRSNRSMMWALSGAREETWRVVRSVVVPTLFLWGEKDVLIPRAVGERAVKELPGSQLIVLDDCGHNPQIECVDEFAGAVTAFLRSVAVRAKA
jgi:pimeloyl-ACP methyl ester carboxylesterase